MLKRIALVAFLLTGTSAAAQVGPQIAYAEEQGRPEVHLINPDGTGSRLLYRGPNRTSIFAIDIRPGGGQLAFEQTPPLERPAPSGAGSQVIVIDYDASGSMVGEPRSLQLACRTGSIDYHPSDGTLLFRNCSSRISRLNTTTMSASDLGLTHNAFVATWLDATNLLYGAAGKFWTVSTAALSSPTEIANSSSFGSLDASTSGAMALALSFGQIDLLDIPGHSLELNVEQGEDASFSPDDLSFIYITPRPRLRPGGQFLLIRRVDGSGAPTNVAGRGAFTTVDWRN